MTEPRDARPKRRSSSGVPGAARLLLAAVAFDAIGTGLVLPYLFVYLHDVRGMSLSTTGILAAVPAVVALTLAGPMGRAIDVWGARRVQLLALVCQAVGTAGLGAVHAPLAAAVMLALAGVGHAAFWPANQSLVADIVAPAATPRYFGMSFAMLNVGIALGGVIGSGFVDESRPLTFQIMYFCNAASFLVPMLVLAGPLRGYGNRPAAQPPGGASTGSYAEVLRDPRLRTLLVVVFLSAFAGYGQIEVGWTAYAREVSRVDPRTIGLAFGLGALVVVAAQLPVVNLVETRRLTRAFVLLAGVWALSWGVLAISGSEAGGPMAPALVVTSMLIFAIGETVLAPLTPSLTHRLAPDHLRGRYNASTWVAFQGAAISGPVLGGFLLANATPNLYIGVVLLSCASFAVAALVLERRIGPGPSPPGEGQTSAVPQAEKQVLTAAAARKQPTDPSHPTPTRTPTT